jgi:hypothetical protein
MQAAFGGSGVGFLGAYRVGSTYRPHDFVFSAGWNLGYVGGYDGGPFNKGQWAGNSGTSTVDLTNVTCIQFEVFYTLNSFSGGSFTVKTNGTLMATISQSSTTPAQATSWMSSACNLSDATITITAPSTSGNYLMFNGIALYGSTTGVIVDNIGFSGSKAIDYASDNPAADHFMPSYFTNARPALTLVTFDSNDYASQTAGATYSASISNILYYARQYYGSAVVINGPYRTTGQTIPQTTYHMIERTNAIGQGCGILSIYDRWNGATSQALFSGDATHPDTPGHVDWANYVYGVLTK